MPHFSEKVSFSLYYQSMSNNALAQQSPQIAQLLDFMAKKVQVQAALAYFPHLQQKRTRSLSKWSAQHIRAFLEKQAIQSRARSTQTDSQGHRMPKYWSRKEKGVMEWLTVSFMYMHKVGKECREEIVQFVQAAMPHLHPMLAKYTLCSLLKIERSTKSLWDLRKTQLFSKIVRAESNPVDWEIVSIRLFEESEGEYFEPFWTCREKWNNYLSPSLNKGEWSLQEELDLLIAVSQSGRRWASIAVELGGTRTEHMVKNRFMKMMKESTYKGNKNEERSVLAYLIRQKKKALKRMQTEKSSSEGDPEEIEVLAQEEAEKLEEEGEEFSEGGELQMGMFELGSEGIYLREQDVFCCLNDAKRSLDVMMEIEEKVREPMQPVCLFEESLFDFDFI